MMMTTNAAVMSTNTTMMSNMTGMGNKTMNMGNMTGMGNMTMDMSSMTSGDYCTGTGSVMLKGFSFDKRGCVLLFFPGWVLNTMGKEAGAGIGLIIMAIAYEWMQFMIRKVSAKVQKKDINDDYVYPWCIRFINGVARTLTVGLGYMLMLVAMTYDPILTLCVVVGYGIGAAIFGDVTPPPAPKKTVEDQKVEL